MKIESHIEKIENAVAAHVAVLEAAKTKADAERTALEQQQKADAALLTPLADAAASLRNRLNALLAKRDELADALRIGRNQLTQQTLMADEFEMLTVGNFGNVNCHGNPGVFKMVMENRVHCFLAVTIVPKLKAWIVEKEEALTEIEKQIAELAKSAKPPVK